MVADVDLLVIGFETIAYATLVLLGERRRPLMLSFAGIVAIFLALELFSVTASIVLGVVWSAIGIWTTVLGIAGELGD